MAFGSSAVAIWVAIVAICLGSVIVMCQEGENNGNQEGQYNGNNGYDDVQNYRMLPKSTESGQEKALCMGTKSRCQYRIMRCPAECPERKPKKARKVKGCMIDCSNKCETTCKYRKPNCKGYGSICYDPRFVGGDGVLFYFHGAKDRDFALVSDRRLQINAHFIGIKPEGRKRPYTWVQALGLMFESHTFTVASRKVSHWDDAVDQLVFTFDGEEFTIPTESLAVWTPKSGVDTMSVERTDDTNSVNVLVPGLAMISVNVAPILEKENVAHNYQLPADDVFAHLEMQFQFFSLSADVEGVLGQTYRPGFVNPVKRGVPMPVMGGEDKFGTSSLLSADCKYCKYGEDGPHSSTRSEFALYPMETPSTDCTSGNGNGGIVCRR